VSIEKALKFVIGAVARKDHVEELCHVSIRNGRAIAYDGMLSMSTPIDIGLNVMPHARSLLKAIQQCEDDVVMSLHVTPAGKLSIKSGNFKVLVQCLDKENPTPQPMPSGQKFEVAPALLTALRTLAPLMSVDASRPWARGLLLCGNSVFATNNIVLAECWHGSGFPGEVILPDDAVTTLLKINKAPTHAQMDENSCTFFFDDDRWMRTNLVDGQWPRERITALLDAGGDVKTIPEGFFTELARLKNFVDIDNGVRLYDDHFATSANEDDAGARIDFDFPGAKGHFNLNQLVGLEGIAQQIDFSTHPAPCYWRGGMARGVIIGRSD
jgi:DNA polymerase III sliding clamp (beta) subunit (PCNA family)